MKNKTNLRRIGLNKYKIIDTKTNRIIEKFRNKFVATEYFKELKKYRNNIELKKYDNQPTNQHKRTLPKSNLFFITRIN